MSLISKTGMDWDEFVDISLASMVKIADEIGL
jgi:predicted hydrolase (HD superfamily)